MFPRIGGRSERDNSVQKEKIFFSKTNYQNIDVEEITVLYILISHYNTIIPKILRYWVFNLMKSVKLFVTVYK